LDRGEAEEPDAGLDFSGAFCCRNLHLIYEGVLADDAFAAVAFLPKIWYVDGLVFYYDAGKG